MGNHLKVFAKQLIRLFGYELVTADTAREYLQAGNLRELFRRFDIALALDVGANEGQFHDFLRHQVMYQGPVVSFEPITALAERLSMRARHEPNWEIQPTALGANRGSGQFNFASAGTISSFLPFAESMQHLPFAGFENVAIDSIDRLGPVLFREIPPERTFLKLDTQGYDIQVLKGANKYVHRFPFLTTNVPFMETYERIPDFMAYFDYLQDLGFDLAGMWPTSRDDTFRARDFDCLFVNSRSKRVDHLSGR